MARVVVVHRLVEHVHHRARLEKTPKVLSRHMPATPPPSLCGHHAKTKSHTNAHLNRAVDDNTPGNSAGIHACAFDIHRHLRGPETDGTEMV